MLRVIPSLIGLWLDTLTLLDFPWWRSLTRFPFWCLLLCCFHGQCYSSMKFHSCRLAFVLCWVVVGAWYPLFTLPFNPSCSSLLSIHCPFLPPCFYLLFVYFSVSQSSSHLSSISHPSLVLPNKPSSVPCSHRVNKQPIHFDPGPKARRDNSFENY